MKEKIASPVIGLDIGSSSIKCVEAVASPEQLRVENAVWAPLKNASLETVSFALKEIARTFSILHKEVRVAVSGTSVLMRRISLPLMTRGELKGAIRFEAERHIPFPVDDCVLDFKILNQMTPQKKMDVLLVAAKRDLIDNRLKLLAEAGIHPEVIDVNIFSVLNAFEFLSETPDKTYGFLDIGHDTSSFAVIHEKALFLARILPVGGVQVTKALAAMKGISEEDASQMKIKNPEGLSHEMSTATEKGSEQLVSELKHSIDYFENEVSGELKSIWVSGGGARVAGLASFLSEELGRSVVLWEQFKKIQLAETIDQKLFAEHALEFPTALGMTLRTKGQTK